MRFEHKEEGTERREKKMETIGEGREQGVGGGEERERERNDKKIFFLFYFFF